MENKGGLGNKKKVGVIESGNRFLRRPCSSGRHGKVNWVNFPSSKIPHICFSQNFF